MVDKVEDVLNYYSFYKYHKNIDNGNKSKTPSEVYEQLKMLNLYTLLPNIPEKNKIKCQITKIELYNVLTQVKGISQIESDILKEAIIKNYNEIQLTLKPLTISDKTRQKICEISPLVKTIEENRKSFLLAKQMKKDEVIIRFLLLNRNIRPSKSYLLFPIEISLKKEIPYLDFCHAIMNQFHSIFPFIRMNDKDLDLDNKIHIYKANSTISQKELNLIVFNAILLFAYNSSLIINKEYFTLENKETFTLSDNDTFIIDLFNGEPNIFSDSQNNPILSCYYCKQITFNNKYWIPKFNDKNKEIQFHKSMFIFLSSENKINFLIKNDIGLQFNREKSIIAELPNFGNTGYFNSGLQCILQCKYFIKYLELEYVKYDCLNKQFEKLPLSQAFCTFLNALSKNVKQKKLLKELYDTFTTIEKKYKAHNQYDCGEFLSDFLNVLDSELNRSTNFKIAVNKEKNYITSLLKFTKKNNSIITDMFYGQMENIYKCNCKSTKENCICKEEKCFEYFLLFQLNLKVGVRYFEAFLIACNNTLQQYKFNIPLSKVLSIRNICDFNKQHLKEKPEKYYICRINKITHKITIITEIDFEIAKECDFNNYNIYIFQQEALHNEFRVIIVPTVIKEKTNWIEKMKDLFVPKSDSSLIDIQLLYHPFQIPLIKDVINYLTFIAFNQLRQLLHTSKTQIQIKPPDNVETNVSSETSSFELNDTIILYYNLEKYIIEVSEPLLDYFSISNSNSIKISNPNKNDTLSLQECLLINSNYLHCSSKCKCNQETSINIKITKLPLYFLIGLKKTLINEKGKQIKINNNIEYPEQLNLYEYVNQDIIKEEDCHYQLIGIVNHIGTISRGHYTSLIKINNKWVECNDDILHYADYLNKGNSFTDNTSTILFYQKIIN